MRLVFKSSLANNIHNYVYRLTLAVLVLLTGCNNKMDSTANADGAGPPQVYSVNYPLYYFAQRIGGEQIESHFPVPKKADAAGWQPDLDTIGLFQNADLILLNGAGYAEWIKQVSLPNSKLVNTSAAVEDQYIYAEDTITHQHGPEGNSSDRTVVSDLWLDLKFAIIQAKAVETALSKLLPQHASTFQDRFVKLEQELLSLDKFAEETAAKHREIPLIGSVDYRYFARRYRLNFKPVNWKPNRTLDQTKWELLRELLVTHPAKAILLESEPTPQIQNGFFELGLQTIVVYRADNWSDEGDFLEVMEGNIRRLNVLFE